MSSDNVSWLATVEEIKQAIEICRKQEKSKSKIIAFERELKRRLKDEQRED